MIHPPFLTKSVRLSPATYCSLCRNCDLRDVVPCHWSPDASHPLFKASTTDFRKRFLLSGIFYLHSVLLPSRPPWCQQFNLKGSRASCWSSKHSPGSTIASNYNNPQKKHTGRFHLCASGLLGSKDSTAMEPVSH